MSGDKKYYVSAELNNLDIGLTVEAPNEYMAVIYGLEVLTDDYGLERCDITITDIEEKRYD
ncbi:hypothetical protein [Streptococcus hyointestinalis]|uniref:hypothetical protein n=1 Tax=Streptococcus hyointestinalis TaxID=1337 RepID=UPI0013DF3BE6|nr:hypothetical protein [Streptococcus hyointestinalis]